MVETSLLWVFLHMKGDLKVPMCQDVHYGLEIGVIDGFIEAEDAIDILNRCEENFG